MKKFIYHIVFIVALIMQSCFQDLDQNPDFNYPQQPPPPTYAPQKLMLTFEDNAKDESNYKIQTQVIGKASFSDGKKGKAYQGAEDAYILITPNPATYSGDISIRDTIANLGSFTIAFWMKTKQPEAATGIFSISNTKKFWGNLDIFMEKSAGNEAFFKMHLYNGNTEKWVGNAKIAGAIGDWVHLAFRYDAKTELLHIFKNGEIVIKEDFSNFGKIAYNDMGQLVVGTLQFQTKPSLTSAAEAQNWAKSYTGLLDEFRFYNKAISDSEIKKIATEK